MEKTQRRNQREVYFELIRRFPLKSIQSESELGKATKIVDELVDRFSALGRWEREYLNILGDLIKAYEDKHHQIGDPEPHEMLAHLIDSRDISQRAVALATGISVSTISELLSQKRTFTLSHIEKLSAYFGVNPAVFIPAK